MTLDTHPVSDDAEMALDEYHFGGIACEYAVAQEADDEQR